MRWAGSALILLALSAWGEGPPPEAKAVGPGVVGVDLGGAGTGDVPGGNDCAVMRFTARRRDGGALFSTSGTRGQTTVQCLATATPGMRVALGSMRVGERKRFWWVNGGADSGKDAEVEPGEHAAPAVPLVVEIELVGIERAPATPEDLAGPRPATATKLGDGVWLRVLRAAPSGAKQVGPASTVTVHFTSWNRAGRIVTTTEMAGHPATFTLGSAPAGWREALPRMSVGEKVRLWVPSSMAAPGSLEANQGGTVVYDLEVLSLR